MKISEITIPIDSAQIQGTLALLPNSTALVIFVHGSGSSRFSTRNQYVASILNAANISTLLFDLLTQQEEPIDEVTRQFRFDIPLLSKRLVHVTQWLKENDITTNLKVGYFGASTGAAAALIAAAQLPESVDAIVSRGGRPDLAGAYLLQVRAPTLFIVGEQDHEVIRLNEQAFSQLASSTKELHIIPGATHLFEEPGTLEKAAYAALDWFAKFLLDIESNSIQ